MTNAGWVLGFDSDLQAHTSHQLDLAYTGIALPYVKKFYYSDNNVF